MPKLIDAFDVKYTRYFDTRDKTSIAELAQFTDVSLDDEFLISSVYDQLRKEWEFEIDEDSIFYYVDFKAARAVFKDGSTLLFKRKK